MAVAVVDDVAQLIPPLPFPPGQVVERQAHNTLALVRRIIDDGQQPCSRVILPRKNQKAIPRPIAFPSGHAFEPLPTAVAHDGQPEDGQESLMKRLQCFVARLVQAATQMGRNTLRRSIELSLGSLARRVD